MKKEEVMRYLNNLDEDALRQVANQLLCHPQSRPFILKSIAEFERFYRFPLDEDKQNGKR